MPAKKKDLTLISLNHKPGRGAHKTLDKRLQLTDSDEADSEDGGSVTFVTLCLRVLFSSTQPRRSLCEDVAAYVEESRARPENIQLLRQLRRAAARCRPNTTTTGDLLY